MERNKSIEGTDKQEENHGDVSSWTVLNFGIFQSLANDPVTSIFILSFVLYA